MDNPPLEVKVWSKMACFTRPENKVERVSYPVPTPSAARGVLEAIFWKPEIEWRVREIVVLKPIRYVGFLRNEVNSKASPSSSGISITDDRAQRHTLGLCSGPKDDDYVEYIFKADVVLKPGVEYDVAKYRDQFRRRVQRGQCFHRPYLGCREFAADFAVPEPGQDKPIAETRNLGLMLFDIAFGPSGANYPIFFDAKLENGVLRVPDSLYDQREALRI
jgi:CRISPR-associated protein Cas5d